MCDLQGNIISENDRLPSFPVCIKRAIEPKIFGSITSLIMTEIEVSGKRFAGFQAYSHAHNSRDDSREEFLKLYSKNNQLSEEVFFNSVEKFTIVIREAYKILPFALNLRNIWKDAFACHVNTNIYVSSSTSDAFPLHKDPHHVFVLQLFGEKKWFITEFESDEKNTYSDRIKSELVTSAGDLFFIPKGVFHKAKAIKSSIHISISIEEKNPT